ncbi:MAG: electron transfer flavoprotein subunit alpha/FixB family protein [Syntrophomonas sp.]
MAGVLVYSDKDSLALELLTAAREMATALNVEVKTLSINNGPQAHSLAEAGAKAYKADNSELILADTACIAAALKQAMEELALDTVLLSSNRRGKELAGRLAQMSEAGCITDVLEIKIEGRQVNCQRNALGGATVATVNISSARKVIAIMPRAFSPAVSEPGGSVNDIALKASGSGIKVVEVRGQGSDSADIESANVLVAVGQGLNSKEDLAMVEALAKKLGGEIACSKPVATDKKWLSEDRVIGLSGKKCKPELAILLGISGQVQFTVGIRDARTIVAVNTDENAYINQMADYILNSDLHEVVAELNKTL